MTQRYNMESICSVNQLMQKGNLFSNGLESEQNDQLIMPLLHLITGATMVPNAFGIWIQGGQCSQGFTLSMESFKYSSIHPSVRLKDFFPACWKIGRRLVSHEIDNVLISTPVK